MADFLGRHADRTTADGRRRIVRYGQLPERSIITGIGSVIVRQPRVRDRAGAAGERIRFSPNILPRYARRTKSLEAWIPILYLKRISTGDFEEALSALVGKDPPDLSASTIARLKDAWSEEHERWRKCDPSAKRYVYWRVDGIYLEARLEDQAQCILVIIGATPEGKKELVGFANGVREPRSPNHQHLGSLKQYKPTAFARLQNASSLCRPTHRHAEARRHKRLRLKTPLDKTCVLGHGMPLQQNQA